MLRHPEDVGTSRKLRTPSSEQIEANIDCFLKFWDNKIEDEQLILPLDARNEVIVYFAHSFGGGKEISGISGDWKFFTGYFWRQGLYIFPRSGIY